MEFELSHASKSFRFVFLPKDLEEVFDLQIHFLKLANNSDSTVLELANESRGEIASVRLRFVTTERSESASLTCAPSTRPEMLPLIEWRATTADWFDSMELLSAFFHDDSRGGHQYLFTDPATETEILVSFREKRFS